MNSTLDTIVDGQGYTRKCVAFFSGRAGDEEEELDFDGGGMCHAAAALRLPQSEEAGCSNGRYKAPELSSYSLNLHLRIMTFFVVNSML